MELPPLLRELRQYRRRRRLSYVPYSLTTAFRQAAIGFGAFVKNGRSSLVRQCRALSRLPRGSLPLVR
jgi:hypothetical protein